jgi:imidazole glycerol phosphate synthase glutamine amidotransferase subunit
MTREIEVIGYGGGNIGSLLRALSRLEIPYRLVGDHGQPMPSGERPLLLPGVGAFGAVMHALEERGLVDTVKALVREGTPYLGICVGQQVLFESSAESPGVPGLGLIPGQVMKFEQGKVPQIGWNKLSAKRTGWQEGYVYFVNSYIGQPDDPASTLYEANYYSPFCAAVQQGNITAFQFHPEKSGVFGHELLKQWVLEAAAAS